MDIDLPDNEENRPDFDFPKDAKERAVLGIFTPIEKRYDDKKQPYWVVPNQKILVLDPDFLPDSQVAKPKNPWIFRLLFLLLDVIASVVVFLKRVFLKKVNTIPKIKEVKNGFQFKWAFKKFPGKEVTFRIVRVSECLNDPLEYGQPTVTILVEWPTRLFENPPGELRTFTGLFAQADNQFIINPESNNKPSPPIAKPSILFQVHPSDFKVFDHNDASFYTSLGVEETNINMPIVAVMDTGLKYKWEINGNIERSFTIGASNFKFKIAKTNGGVCFPGAEFGYCGITHYLNNPSLNPLLGQLNNLTVNQILSSPYDDNKVDEITNGGQGVINTKVGRHGTLISAILNANQCKVLPVKVFDGGGWGTLFDVIAGCNYVLSCKRNNTNIKVLNASFSGSVNDEGRDILFLKMKALSDQGIWVIAAAGNEDIDLDQSGNMRYPAQFGKEVIDGGIERVITVNSKYSDGTQAGNFGSPVSLTVKSTLVGGFPSALPLSTGLPLEGTSFAAPYAAGVLAHTTLNNVSTRRQALDYLRANQVQNPGLATGRVVPPAGSITFL